jgi:hypothetical protein
MKEPEAIKNLRLILLEPRESLRMTLLDEWITRWIFSTKQTQHVINKSVLNSAEKDFAWYTVATMCAQELMDNEVTSNTSDNNSFNCEVWAIRSSDEKLKENKENTKKIR